MGILSSYTHGRWAWARSSTLKGDIRYTPTTVFETFPWPYPMSAQEADELVHRLLVRNREIAAGERLYDPFGDSPMLTPTLSP
ncbi:MAG: hypothetical protein M3467_03015 [Actinomycetota bacterium]|jgi:hypothetical protein|nr:hypothetical protein [Acidothermales bacterium]MDQ3431189.1 hypothetical protein [Actinomycetota bacterium]